MALRVNRKATVEQVAALAAERLPASEIARRLGVSRQRIYQISHDHGIKLIRATFTPFWEKHDPKQNKMAPRILTGGVYVTRNGNAIGKVSELLVAADLVARGWGVYLPVYENRGYDIIACSRDDILKIEVRSGYRNSLGAITFIKKTYDTSPTHYAVVVTGEPVQYKPDIPEVKPKGAPETDGTES